MIFDLLPLVSSALSDGGEAEEAQLLQPPGGPAAVMGVLHWWSSLVQRASGPHVHQLRGDCPATSGALESERRL